jgi:dCTP deaminase
MSVWSSKTILERAPQEGLIVPFSPEKVKHCAYQLSLGNQVIVTPKSVKQELAFDSDHVIIPPGQFALLLTREIVSVPGDSIGLISIRASQKFKGLVNISGFHVDPGYHGRLKFSVYNAGSRDIVLSAGAEVFMLWFLMLDFRTDDLYRSDVSHNTIETSDVERMRGEVATPSALAERLKKVENSIKMFRWVGGVLFVAILSLVGNFLIAKLGP